MLVIRLVLVSFFLFVTPVVVYCQHLDLNFQPSITKYPQIEAAAFQDDGKIVLAGDFASVGDVPVNNLIRINVDGSLDPTFTSSIIQDFFISKLIVDPQGRILVAGKFSGDEYLMRFNPDGTKDQTFHLASGIRDLYNMLSYPGDRYLILASPGSLYMIKSDGTLDEGFSAGTGLDSFGTSTDIAVQPDGKIIVAGMFTHYNNVPANRVLRLNIDGSIDNTFSVGAGPMGSNANIKSIALQDDGKLLLAGFFTNFNNVNAKNIVRLMSDGTVDPSFVLPGPTGNFLTMGVGKIMLFGDGILIAGLRQDANLNFEYALTKLHSEGMLDDSFSSVLTNVILDGEIWDPILLTHENSIFFSGYFSQIGSSQRAGAAMLNETGEVNSFNPILRGRSDIRAVSVQTDGKILIGGIFKFVGTVSVNNLARLNPDGSLDESFYENIGSGPDGIVTCIQQQSDGKILIGGAFSKFDGFQGGQLIRLKPDGSIDAAFKPNIELLYGGYGINAILLLPSGKLLVGGVFNSVNGHQANNLVMLNQDGTMDNSFNSDLLTPNERVYAIAKHGSDNLLIGGEGWPESTGGFFFKTDAEGNVQDDFPELDLSNQAVRTIKVMADDRFVFGGGYLYSLYERQPNALYQFNKDATLVDNISLAVYSGLIKDLGLISDDEIVLAGDFKEINGVESTGLERVKFNGSLNSAYNFDVAGSLNCFYKADPDRSLFYAAGKFTDINNTKFFSLARIDFDEITAPSDLTHTIDNGNGIISLHWSDHSDNETGFVVFRSEEGQEPQPLDSVLVDITSYTDSLASPLKIYHYSVRAYNKTKNSAVSNTVNISTMGWVAPVTPGNLQYSFDAGLSSIVLTWTDASDNENSFELERSLNNSDFALLETLARDVDIYIVPFDFETLYSYRIRATNKFGKSEYAEILELPLITQINEGRNGLFPVSPNPATDRIKILNEHQKFLQIAIVNLSGVSRLTLTSNEREINVDIKTLPPGFYIVQTKDGKGLTTTKLIKQ